MKTGKCAIYCIVTPEKEVYVGASTNVKSRIRSHIINSSCKKLRASMRKYGYEKHNIFILEYCNERDLRKRESFYIITFSRVNVKLLNRNGSYSCGLKSNAKRKRTMKLKKIIQKAIKPQH